MAQALLIYGNNTFPEGGESNKNTKGVDRVQVFSHKLIRFTLVLGAVLTVLMAALGSCLLLVPLAALRRFWQPWCWPVSFCSA